MEEKMKSLVLSLIMLCMAFFLFAEYVPQTLIFSSVDQIETITQYSDSLYTDHTSTIWYCIV